MTRPLHTLHPVIFCITFLYALCLGQDYGDWAHSQRLLLNTSSTGANVENDVTGFAVLVRLNPVNFKYFSQTKPGGADIRFAAADGTTPLDYNIERWVDVFPNNDTADIWVSVPTISGDNFTQSIVMYWGNPAATDNSDGSSVFALSNGYEAVWHLGDVPVDSVASIVDQTSGTANATPYGTMSINDREPGNIGYSLEFDGFNNYLETTFRTPASVRTLSAWIYPHTSDTTQFLETIIDNDKVGEYGNGFGLDDDTIKIILDNEFWPTNQRVAFDQWQHVMLAFNATQAVVYYNGVPVATHPYTQGALTDTVYYIGRSAANPEMFFHGRIDELRIEDDFKSADWAKLCYESQKLGQSLIPTASVMTWDVASTAGTQIDDGTWGTDDYWTFNGTQLVPWLGQGHTAVFDGSAGSYTITVSGTQTVDSISIQSGINCTFTDGTINFDTRSGVYVDDGTTTIGSVVAGSGGLRKYGTGTLRLSGTNTYTGTTNVTSGTLVVNGTIGGAATVASGATLGGTGSIGGTVTANGATIAPGSGGAGELTLGALTLNGSSTVDVELGTSSDIITGTGTMALDGTIDITPVAGFDAGTYRIANTSSTVTDNGLAIGTAPAGRIYTIDAGTDYVDIQIATDLLQSEPPADTEVIAGPGLTLSVTAEGEGTLTYLWLRSPDDTVGSAEDLVIAAIDSSYDGAQYRCIVTDSFSADTSRWVALSVIDTPRIITQPQDIDAIVGDDITLSIEVLDTAQVQYRWEKTGSSTSLGTTAALSIDSVTEADSGDYICIVSNPAATDTSAPARLSVGPLVPTALFGYTPQSGTVPLEVSFSDSSTGVVTGYEWDFGDGDTDTTKNPTHTYTTTGDYAVLLTVTGPGGSDVSDTSYVYVGDSIPVARFDYTPTSGGVPLEVAFTDLSTGIITSRTWDFGDGDTDTTKNPSHTYEDTGSYAVLLAVEGPGGTDTTDTVYVTVILPAPVAGFDYSPKSGVFPLTVEFTDTSTGVITSRTWEFGDGATDTSENPTHTYEETGSYAVLLAVEGPGGTDTTDTVYVTVSDSTPVAAFDYTPESGSAPLEVTFTDGSTGDLTSRLWSFGDGESDTVQNPQHTYTDPGTYSVTLTVTGPGGTDSLTVTDAITVTALEGDDTLQSALELEELTFDSAGAAIRISWCIDSAQYADDLEVGVAYRAGTPPDGMDGSQVVTILERCTDTVVHLNEPILFDTVYHVALFLRTTDAPWPGPTSRARGSVPIGAPYRQDVTFDETNEEVDTVRIFNDRIRLREDDDFATLVLTDTVEVYDYTPPAGFTVTGTPIVFVDADRALPFYVGIRIRNLPAAASASQVRIYRVDKNGAITVEHESTVDTASGFVYVLTDDLSLPFIAMVDDAKPQVIFSGVPDSVARAESSLIDTVAIRDNISNVRWTYLYSRGDHHPTARDSGTLSDTAALVRLSISSSSQVISSEYGLRAILVVTDGVRYDTLDLSRAVYRTNSDEFITTAGIWHPVYPTARLYATDPDSAIIVRAGKDGEYDNHYIRLFRWLQHSTNETDNWLEYDPENSSLQSFFAVTPGRLFWIKTRDNTLIHLGDGRTISTRDTVTMELPAGEYTDFGLPFRFDIQLESIFDATRNDADSLQVYAWKRDSSTRRYYLDRVYITTMADKNDPTTVLSYQEGGYSMFNPYGRAVVMRLPPTLAPDDTAEMGKRKKADPDDPSWGTKLLLATSHGTAHPAVYCGYTPGVTKGIFPVAPTFLQLNAFIFDRATGTKAGHAVSENAAGGLTEEVRIVNSSDSAMHLAYRFENAGAFPETYRTVLYDGASGHAAPDGSIDLEPHSAISRWIVAGDNKYFTQFKNATAAFRHGFSRIFPNPSRSVVNFRFSVGFGTQEKVRLTVFDLRGRKVWETQMTALLAAGEHVITWNGYDRNHSTVGAGRYPVRLSFIDEQGNVTRRFDRMITLIP